MFIIKIKSIFFSKKISKQNTKFAYSISVEIVLYSLVMIMAKYYVFKS